MMKPKRVKKWASGLESYYGQEELWQMNDGTYRLCLENYSGLNYIEVSPTFAEAFIAEFPRPRKMKEKD
jgi:hypothetical protein